MTNLSLSITDPAGKETGTIDLPASLFDRDPNIPLMHRLGNAQLAAARQGTQRPRPVVRYAAVARSRGGKRELVGLVKALSALRNGVAVG